MSTFLSTVLLNSGYFNFIAFLGCGPENVTVVSGDRYSSHFPVEALLTHDNKEIWSPASYWLGPNGRQGHFILDLGCPLKFNGIQLVNSHNYHHKDRATKQFR